MAIVIGTTESISSIVKDLGNSKIHMNQISDKKTRDLIISKLNFKDRTCLVFCIRIDRDNIVKQVQSMRKTKRRNISKAKITHTYNHILWKQLEDKITNFPSIHHFTLQNVIFQCDDDCRKFIKDNSLTDGDPKDAHMLSDIVAWANNRGREPDGVISLDLRHEIKVQLLKRI